MDHVILSHPLIPGAVAGLVILYIIYRLTLARTYRDSSPASSHWVQITDKNGNALTYSEYLNTNYWKNLRRAFGFKHGWRCKACRRRGNVRILFWRIHRKFNLHHIRYHRKDGPVFWRERDKDLRLLCESHHRRAHAFSKKTGLKLSIATKIYIGKTLIMRYISLALLELGSLLLVTSTSLYLFDRTYLFHLVSSLVN